MKRLSLLLCLCFASIQPGMCLNLSAHTWTTDNGLNVVYYPAHQVPMVVMTLGFDAGSARDGEKYGIAQLTNEMIGEDSQSADASLISERFADVGAQFSKGTERTMAMIKLKSLSKPAALKASVDNLADLLANFQASQKPFKRIQQQQLVAIQAGQQNANAVANDVFFQTLYGHHPYAHPVSGTMASVKQLKLTDIKPFFDTHYGAKQATLVLVGDLDRQGAEKIARQIAQALPASQANIEPIARAESQSVEPFVKKAFPSSQTIIRIGQLGIDYHSPELFPLKVGNYILGGGSLVSRLAFEVREKRGLSYGVSSQFVPMPATGPFVISLSTKQNQVEQAIHVTESTTRQFIKQGPDAQELKEAKQYLIGSFPLSLSSNDKIAAMLLRIHFFALPADYLQTYRSNVNAVTAEQVRASLAKQINLKKMLRIEVGKIQTANNV